MILTLAEMMAFNGDDDESIDDVDVVLKDYLHEGTVMMMYN
jgi:hypothetical protein